MTDEFVEEWSDGIEYIEHRNGVPWYKAPVGPRLFHRHRVQTCGLIRGDVIQRCACGAYGPAPWFRLDPWPKKKRKAEA